MRWLALVRYRFLHHVRRANWVVPVLVVAIILPTAVGMSVALMPDAQFRRRINEYLMLTGVGLLITYWIHIGALTMLCWSFGIAPRRPEGAKPSDLMDTVPVSGYLRFWGDAAGIAAAILAIHVCTTPLLAYAVALSPFPSSLFWYLELVIVFMVATSGIAASWSLRAETSRWAQTRSVRSSSLFALLLTLVVLGTTRVEDFGVALDTFFREPSARSWSGIPGTIHSMPLFIGLLVLVTGAFVTYFAVRSARMIEEG
jgi:hypothetical protein